MLLIAVIGSPGPRNQCDIVLAVQGVVSGLTQDQRGLRGVPGGWDCFHRLRLFVSVPPEESKNEGSFLLRSSAGGFEVITLVECVGLQVQDRGLET